MFSAPSIVHVRFLRKYAPLWKRALEVRSCVLARGVNIIWGPHSICSPSILVLITLNFLWRSISIPLGAVLWNWQSGFPALPNHKGDSWPKLLNFLRGIWTPECKSVEPICSGSGDPSMFFSLAIWITRSRLVSTHSEPGLSL